MKKLNKWAQITLAMLLSVGALNGAVAGIFGTGLKVGDVIEGVTVTSCFNGWCTDTTIVHIITGRKTNGEWEYETHTLKTLYRDPRYVYIHP